MKKIYEAIGFSAIGFLTAFLLLRSGAHTKQAEIKKRALILQQKECYTGQDIEYIIYGEIQE